MSKIDDIRQQRAKKKQMSDEEAAKLKKAANIIFNSEEGVIVAKAMMKVSGIYKLVKTNNPVDMATERGKEYMYLFFCKGLLNQDLLTRIESRGGA
ncbi:MAG: hypothetical protein U9R01_07870 [candidate division WOR-3 bacterium]|nr:hypothetical protein [candidate division WOR-3 bacterium]